MNSVIEAQGTYFSTENQSPIFMKEDQSHYHLNWKIARTLWDEKMDNERKIIESAGAIHIWQIGMSDMEKMHAAHVPIGNNSII